MHKKVSVHGGSVIWITGFSGAGKTTLARQILPYLENGILIDGDSMRYVLGTESSHYTKEEREKLAFIYARLCKTLSEQGVTIVCATISMFHSISGWNKIHLPGYFEVYLDVPLSVRKYRKQLYHDKTEIVDDSFDVPSDPDLVITHEDTEIEGYINDVMRAYLNKYRPTK